MNNGRAAIIGSGTIGTSLALACSMNNWNTTLVGRRSASIENARKTVQNFYTALSEADLLPDSSEGWENRLDFTTELAEACDNVDIVIEAINEDISDKQTLFSNIENHVKDTTILASSTSGLPIDSISALCRYRRRIATAHFANPPHLMPLVEIVPGSETEPDCIDKLCQFVESLGKEPIRLNRDLPGHLFNRIQFAMLREAMALARDQVASAEDIDKVVKKGLALRLAEEGPLQKIDLAGFELVCSVCEYLFPDLDVSQEPDYLKKMLSDGHLGSKNGRGFYQWTEEDIEDVISRRNQEVIRHLRKMQNNC